MKIELNKAYGPSYIYTVEPIEGSVSGLNFYYRTSDSVITTMLSDGRVQHAFYQENVKLDIDPKDNIGTPYWDNIQRFLSMNDISTVTDCCLSVDDHGSVCLIAEDSALIDVSQWMWS